MFSCTTLAMLTLIAAPAAAKMPTPINYGKPFAVVNPIPLPKLPKLAPKKLGTKVQVIGPVHKVCTKKGCWMSLKDGDARMRIGFKDYSFFMPTSLASGTIVVVKGVLESVQLSEAQVAHLEKEGAKVPKSGKELKLVADGAWVEFTNR